MNELTQDWMTETVRLPGMLGCALAKPDGDGYCQSMDESACPPEKLAEILNQLEGARNPVTDNDHQPQWRTWVFAGGKIRSATRSDGWVLLTVVRADSVAAQKLDQIFADCMTLPPGG